MSNNNSWVIFPLAAILVSGCSRSGPAFPVAPHNALAESITLEVRPFEIGSNRYEADFGTIAVPENRSKAVSRLISIPFLRIRSTAKNPAEPIFALSGGPGQSNMSWDWKGLEYLLSQRDLAVTGYRGVDGPVMLDCPEVAEALKAHGDPLSEQSLDAIGHAWEASARRLAAEGVDLDGYTMLECIEDNESVRRALGYNRLDLLSASYGTRVAYLYGLKHPESVFRSAMISVNPPGHFVWEPAVIDSQLRYYAALWSQDPGLSARSVDLYGTMGSVLTDMPHRWLFFPIDPGRVKVVTVALLFQRKTAAMVFDAYVAAERGDASGLAFMSMAYNFVMPSLAVWGDLASKAVSADYDSTRSYAQEMDRPGMPLGSPMSKICWGPLRGREWPTRRLPEQFRTLQRSDVETLLLSGSVDFSTPAQFATRELLPYLKNGKQVIFSECGHVQDVMYSNPDNTRRVLTSFFDTGVPDVSLNRTIPMDFAVGWGFPFLARAAFGAMVVLGILFIAVVVWLLRKYQRRRARMNSKQDSLT
jgi:pimeloyl-ACP methyl ester carboxylesterase